MSNVHHFNIDYKVIINLVTIESYPVHGVRVLPIDPGNVKHTWPVQ